MEDCKSNDATSHKNEPVNHTKKTFSVHINSSESIASNLESRQLQMIMSCSPDWGTSSFLHDPTSQFTSYSPSPTIRQTEFVVQNGNTFYNNKYNVNLCSN